MKKEQFIGRKTYLWGTGVEGQAVISWWNKNLANETLGIIEENIIPDDAEIIIKSPGVSFYLPQIKEAKNRGVIFTSVLNIFFANLSYKPIVIGITGTKGKSTSVSMLSFMLEKLGKKVGLAGNIGTPPLDFLEQKVDYLVFELSSFQIMSLDYPVDYAMVVNISQAHTDWHLTYENYRMDKLSILKYPQTVKILNYEDKWLREFKGNNIIYYDKDNGFHVDGGSIYDKKEKLDLPPLQIFGAHNLSNICGVLTIIKSLGLDYKKALSALKDFAPLEHRLQKVYEKNGLKFINDSIATVADSVIAGVNSFDEDIALIVGGFDNGPDYTELDKFIENTLRIKVALCLPDTGRMLKNSKCVQVNNMKEAVFEAVKRLKKGIVLLSPAAPSFNMYKNYKERGYDFTNLAKELSDEVI
ncbi:MAG: UDP-N-acetylmuramoyl-L-alanine--D-glutamate ligase [Lactobacillaceae bacterium]|nr:UDP-N-acetylmuramoyl-L-alanine--D-glutamate ligase [Lactobacillaceae bacterium]